MCENSYDIVMNRLFLIAALLLVTACSGKEGKINKAARTYGEADARTLIDSISDMSQLEVEGYILGVKATEYEYIEEGHEKAARLYIEGFENYIRENSDSLAREIF